MKKIIAVLMVLFAFYTDVSSSDYSNSSSEAGSQSESNYGYSKGKGI